MGPALPPKVTGNVDLAQPANGASGTFQHDMDGDGVDDTIDVFQDAGGVVYESWAGSDGNAECGATDGAWICTLDNDAAECAACNAEGACTQCNEESDEPCEWPEPGQPVPDGGIQGDDGGEDPGCGEMCTALVTCELDFTTVDECVAACDPAQDGELMDCVEQAADSCAAVAACLPTQ